MIDALVVAGSPNDGNLQGYSTEPFEALIPIGGRTMVEHVVEALINSQQVRNIVVVGPAQLKEIFNNKAVQVVVHHSGIVSNVAAGVKYLPDSKRILLVPGDVPLITPDIIDCFIDNCHDDSYDLYFPIIPKHVMENKYPAMKRTYVTLQDGTFTAGNVFIVNADKIPIGLEKGQEFIELRKSPLKLCRLLGANFVMKFLMHRLTIAEIEQQASKLLHLRGRAIICNTPELGLDVDKPSDLSIVRQIITYAGN